MEKLYIKTLPIPVPSIVSLPSISDLFALLNKQNKTTSSFNPQPSQKQSQWLATADALALLAATAALAVSHQPLYTHGCGSLANTIARLLL